MPNPLKLAMLKFAGPDVVSFLQGYLTCDTDALRDAAWQLTALCNLKGRTVASGWARRNGDQIDWVLHNDLADEVLEFLSPYLRFSKTEAAKAEGSVTPTLAPLDFAVTDSEPALDEFAEHLVNEGIVVVDATTSQEFLPQMIGLVEAGAVSFDKGCYLGQEVVARAQHRGAVKRILVRIDRSDDADGEPTGTVVAQSPTAALAVVRAPKDEN